MRFDYESQLLAANHAARFLIENDFHFQYCSIQTKKTVDVNPVQINF